MKKILFVLLFLLQANTFGGVGKDIIAPVLVNWTVPFGIGSYIQGDIKGGTVALTTELTGVAAMGLGIIIAIGTIDSENYNVGALLLNTAGSGSFLFGAIYQMIRPFVYYRKELSDNSPIHVYPTITLNKQFEIESALNLKVTF